MGYRVCKSTGVIHTCGNDFKKVCARSKNITPGNYEDCRTKDEAEAIARATHKLPRYCKHCNFREALQQEANP